MPRLRASALCEDAQHEPGILRKSGVRENSFCLRRRHLADAAGILPDLTTSSTVTGNVTLRSPVGEEATGEAFQIVKVLGEPCKKGELNVGMRTRPGATVLKTGLFCGLTIGRLSARAIRRGDLRRGT